MRFVAIFLLGIILGISATVAFNHYSVSKETPLTHDTFQTPQIIYGNEQAPIVIIEYSSPACGHCSHFKQKLWPKLKKKYVDHNRIVWVLRPFALMSLDLKASALSFCHKNPKQLLERYYKDQQRWLMAKDPVDELKKMAIEEGIPADQIDHCLENQDILNALIAQRLYAERQHHIDGTPGFVIGQSTLPGLPPLSLFEEIIEKAETHVEKGGTMQDFIIPGSHPHEEK